MQSTQQRPKKIRLSPLCPDREQAYRRFAWKDGPAQDQEWDYNACTLFHTSFGKRKRDDFEVDEHTGQALQLQQALRRTCPTGETGHPLKGPDDSDASMQDAPPLRQVHHTPPQGYYISATTSPNKAPQPPKSILKKRMSPYEQLELPSEWWSHSPFVHDTSAYIEDQLAKDAAAEAAQKQRLHNLIAANKTAAATHPSPYIETRPPKLSSNLFREAVPVIVDETPIIYTDEDTSMVDVRELDSNNISHQKSFTTSPQQQPSPNDSSSTQTSPRERSILTPIARRTTPPRPSATDLYPGLQADIVHLAPTTYEPTPLRRIGGMVVGIIASYWETITSSIWGFFGYSQPKEQEVVAVETDSTRRKRRAVAAEDIDFSQSPQSEFDMMPGEYPPTPELQNKQSSKSMQQASPPLKSANAAEEMAEPSQPRSKAQFQTMTQAQSTLETPPDSRPGSSDSEQPQTAVRAAVQKPLRTIHLNDRDEIRKAQRETCRLPDEWVPKKTYHEPRRDPLRISRLPADALRASQRAKSRNTDETSVDALVERAKRVTLKSAETNKFRESIKTRKQRESDEKVARKLKEQAKLETAQETERLREQADREVAEEIARKKIKEQLVRPLTPEWAEKVNEAMSHKDVNQILAKSPDGVELSRKDLGTLLPQDDLNGMTVRSSLVNKDRWLNDEVVNALMAMIVSRRKEQTGYVKGPDSVPEMEAFTSHWHTTYKSKGIQGVKTWSRRKGIAGEKLLRAKKIFFPINTGAHWMLMIISPIERKIEYLDSLGGTYPSSRKKYFGVAREWLKMELGNAYKADEWLDAKSTSTQQLNADDCGMFTCINALSSAKGKAFNEVPENMGDARRMMVALMLNGGFHGDWEL